MGILVFSLTSSVTLAEILASVAKTGRCVIIHEAARTCGVGAEISAGLAEKGLSSLLAPIERVTGFDTVMPWYKLEKTYMPDEDRIIRSVEVVLDYV